MADEDQALRAVFEAYAIRKKITRDPLKSLLFGVVWLTFICDLSQDKEKTGRMLRLSTETDREKEERIEAEAEDQRRSRNNPSWIRTAVYCSRRIQEMEKQGKGPAVSLRKKYPAPTLQDCPEMASVLREEAVENGLEKETSTEFKKWLGKLIYYEEENQDISLLLNSIWCSS